MKVALQVPLLKMVLDRSHWIAPIPTRAEPRSTRELWFSVMQLPQARERSRLLVVPCRAVVLLIPMTSRSQPAQLQTWRFFKVFTMVTLPDQEPSTSLAPRLWVVIKAAHKVTGAGFLARSPMTTHQQTVSTSRTWLTPATSNSLPRVTPPPVTRVSVFLAMVTVPSQSSLVPVAGSS